MLKTPHIKSSRRNELNDMGGSALGEQLQRLTRERYLHIVDDLREKLAPFFQVIEVPASLQSKTSFGDVDLLVSKPIKVFDAVLSLGSKKTSRNGRIVSFEYCGHQIDLINCDPNKLGLARFFHGYGDLGMILGMMCRVIGLKSGFKNLSMMYGSIRIFLSEDLSKILDFLGLDEAIYQRGFEAELDIFRWISSSIYFRAGMFQRRERGVPNDADDIAKCIWNRDTKERLKTREMFQRFIAFCHSVPNQEERVDPGVVREEALVYFNKTRELEEIKLDETNKRLVKEKFNGRIVGELTGLSGKDLGGFMAFFKTKYPQERLVKMPPDDIKQSVLALFPQDLKETREVVKTHLIEFPDGLLST